MAKGSSTNNYKESSVIARRDSSEESNVVEEVVHDIVDYVIRREEFLSVEVPYDSDFIPTEIQENKNYPCTRHCCQKGCICDSINETVVTKHCKKEDCIFHCICDRRLIYSLRNLPHRITLKIMLSNRNYDETAVPEDSKNKSKPSKRRRLLPKDPPDIQEVPFIDLNKEQDIHQIPLIEIPDDETEHDKMKLNVYDKPPISPISNSVLINSDDSVLAKIIIERNLMVLGDIFVWCPKHRRYSCTCKGWVFDLRENLLLKSSKKSMDTQTGSVHHVFSLEDHCARTFGSVFNYRLRNLSRMFNLKRDFEIRNGVLSNSNSFFKIDPPPSKKNLASKAVARYAPGKFKRRNRDRFESGVGDVIQSSCEPLPEEVPEEKPEIKLIFHYNTDSSEDEIEDGDCTLPKFGLLCLNGCGYLPVKEFNPTKLVFQHPLTKSIFVSKKDVGEANLWLSEFLSGYLKVESECITLKWLVVQRGVLKKSKPFDPDKFYENLKNN